jgi:ParB/RepB/Spo0J family partition protein
VTLPPDKRPKREARDILLKFIHPDPEQPRKEFDQQGLLDLAASLKTNGQWVEVIVRPYPDRPDHFILIDGERRFRAAPFAGLDELHAIVVDGPLDPTQLLMVQMSLGLTNAKLNSLDAGAGFLRLMETLKIDAAELAEKLGTAESTISKSLSVFKYIAPELHVDVRSFAIPFTVAYQLSRLKNMHARQVEIAAAVKANVIGRKGVEEAVNKELGHGRKKEDPPVEVTEGDAVAKFPATWSWDQIVQWVSRIGEAAKRGAKMPGAPTGYLQGLLKNA